MNSEVSRCCPRWAHTLNLLFVLATTLILLSAYGVQFIGRELPCPLCLLQRLAMLGVGTGALLNVKFGIRPRNYGISLGSAILGGIVAGRQILLHIAPNDPGFGSPLWGWHLYTWSFIAFVCIGLLIALMLICDRQFRDASPASSDHVASLRLDAMTRGVLGLFFMVAIANIATTLLLCGLGPCEGDPTHYLWWPWQAVSTSG